MGWINRWLDAKKGDCSGAASCGRSELGTGAMGGRFWGLPTAEGRGAAGKKNWKTALFWGHVFKAPTYLIILLGSSSGRFVATGAQKHHKPQKPKTPWPQNNDTFCFLVNTFLLPAACCCCCCCCCRCYCCCCLLSRLSRGAEVCLAAAPPLDARAVRLTSVSEPGCASLSYEYRPSRLPGCTPGWLLEEREVIVRLVRSRRGCRDG
jgi:hypothetical protein